MIKISPGLYVERDFEGLLRFLTDCRDSALRDNHYKVASISLEVKHLDSLAVLESIYESDELHFYMEHPIKEEAIAGADAILEKTFHGLILMKTNLLAKVRGLVYCPRGTPEHDRGAITKRR